VETLAHLPRGTQERGLQSASRDFDHSRSDPRECRPGFSIAVSSTPDRPKYLSRLGITLRNRSSASQMTTPKVSRNQARGCPIQGYPGWQSIRSITFARSAASEASISHRPDRESPPAVFFDRGNPAKIKAFRSVASPFDVRRSTFPRDCERLFSASPITKENHEFESKNVMLFIASCLNIQTLMIVNSRGIKDAINIAATYADVGVFLNNNLKVYGYWDLTIGAFNR